MSDVVRSDAGGAPQAGWRRFAAPLLLGSLALNLLLIGGTVGGMLAGGHHGGRLAHAPIERGIVGFVRSLPRERSEALLKPFEGRKPQFKEAFKSLREARKSAFDVFTAASVDPVQLKAALAHAAEQESRVEAMGTQLFVDLATQMTPDERQSYRNWRESQDRSHRKARDK